LLEDGHKKQCHSNVRNELIYAKGNAIIEKAKRTTGALKPYSQRYKRLLSATSLAVANFVYLKGSPGLFEED